MVLNTIYFLAVLGFLGLLAKRFQALDQQLVHSVVCLMGVDLLIMLRGEWPSGLQVYSHCTQYFRSILHTLHDLLWLHLDPTTSDHLQSLVRLLEYAHAHHRYLDTDADGEL